MTDLYSEAINILIGKISNAPLEGKYLTWPIRDGRLTILYAMEIPKECPIFVTIELIEEHYDKIKKKYRPTKEVGSYITEYLQALQELKGQLILKQVNDDMFDYVGSLKSPSK